MENTPTGCADDLPTILGFFKKIPKIEKCQHSFQQMNFDPNRIKDFICQPKLRPVEVAVFVTAQKFVELDESADMSLVQPNVRANCVL